MAGSAPNFSVTGFQLSEVKKPKPKARQAGNDPCSSATITPASSTSTVSAEISVTALKIWSSRLKRRKVLARFNSSWTSVRFLSATAAPVISSTPSPIAPNGA